MKQLTIVALVLITAFVSCNRTNNEEEEVLTVSAEDQALAQGLMDEVSNQVESSSGSAEASTTEDWSPCAVITIDTMGAPFPLTIRVDFGTEGCAGPNGRIHRGVLVYNITGWLRNAGSVISVTPENYSIDDFQVEGTRTTTNLGENAAGDLEFSVVDSDIRITDAEGDVIEWQSTRVRTWVEGRETGYFTPDGNGGFMRWQGIADDVYEITGSGSGTNRNGQDFDVTIAEALRVQLNCRWITRGTIVITPETGEPRTLDYGDGSCDRNATITTRRRDRQITLRG